MSYQKVASILCDLGLEHPPVALAIVDHKPADIKVRVKRVVSSCSLWRRAEVELFFASAEDHSGCSVGAHVMGLPLSAVTKQELAASVTLMSEVGYLPGGEVANIPQVGKRGLGVVYGPLADFPLEADCAVVWVNPGQAMLLGEALRTTTWKEPQAEIAALFGRPACSALARTINTKRESFSLGCTGMRTFTEIAPALAFFVIPGRTLSTLAEDLSQVVDSNKKMLAHYQVKKDAFA